MIQFIQPKTKALQCAPALPATACGSLGRTSSHDGRKINLALRARTARAIGLNCVAASLALIATSHSIAAPTHHDEWRPGIPVPTIALRPPACSNRQALGTSRVMRVGVQGGVTVGLKTYPKTLHLADHEVVLTFDDGPLPATTTAVLDALRRECVLATFFLIGRNASAYPELVRREVAGGHTVAHHTFSHPAVTLEGLSDASARLEIVKGIEADEKAAGFRELPDAGPRVPFFRFPGLADTQPLLAWLKAQNIAVFSADIWASDWNKMTPDVELNLLISRIEAARGGIILLHDTRSQTAAMLPRLLEELKRRNYKIVHVVPGPGTAETVDAPRNWKSVTQDIVKRTMQRLAPRVIKPQSDGTPPASGAHLAFG
jgi:peptidoglycan/xylan/chitin deacetylase (PgdA/CDA1 family)